MPVFGWTAFTISSFDSEPPLSTSMSSKQCRAAFLNSFVNSSSSLAAWRAIISCARRCAARAWSLAFSAFSIASSLRGERPVSRADTRYRVASTA